MRNLLIFIIVMFIMGLIAYILSFVVGLANFVADVVGLEKYAFGDPYILYTTFIAGMFAIIAVLTLLIIGSAIRRERVEL